MILLDLYEILPLLSKQYFCSFIETVALPEPDKNRITEKWDPGPMTFRWGAKVQPYVETLGWDPTVGPEILR